MARILLSPSRHFIEIARQLHGHGHELLTILPQFAQSLTEMNIPAKPVAAFNNQSLQERGLTEAARVFRGTRPPKDGFSPVVMKFLQANLDAFLLPRLADLVSFVVLLDEIKPDVVVVHNDVEPLLRTAALWARANRRPCVHVPHAVYLDIEKGAIGDDIHDLITASHICAAGSFQAEWYKVRGAKQVAETGLPQFDEFARLARDPARARQNLGLALDRPVVTYASSWRQDTNLRGSHDSIQELYLAMLQVMKALPEVQFIVKLHPSGNDGEWYVKEAEAAGVSCLIEHRFNNVILQASDLVMCYSGSNLLFEASFFPWVRLMATQGFEQDNEVIKVSHDPPNPAEIAAAINQALSGPPVPLERFRQKYVGIGDGHASHRIVRAIQELVAPVEAGVELEAEYAGP